MSSPPKSSVRVGSGNAFEPPCPILDLPNEIVCCIIATVAQMEPPNCLLRRGYMQNENYSPVGRIAALGFMRLSEVCHRFRALLLSMPQLWAAVFCLLPAKQAELALSRSRSAPLKAYICDMREWLGTDLGNEQQRASAFEHASTAGRQRLVALVVENIQRLCSLNTSNLRSEQYAQLFSSALPFLTDIELRHTRMYETDRYLTVSVDAPALHNARLFIVPENAQKAGFSFKFPSLRSLNMGLLCRSANDKSYLKWIGDLLESSPLIEHLECRIASNNDPMDWDNIFGSRTIQLTHLRSLELEGFHGANLATLYSRIHPNRCARSKIMSVFINGRGAECEEDATNLLKICGPALQHQSYDGLSVSVEKVAVGRKVSQFPCLQVASYPLFADTAPFCSKPWRKYADMPKVIDLTLTIPIDTNSRTNDLISDAISNAFGHNNTRQLAIDFHEYAESPEVQTLATRIWEALDKLARSRDGGQPGERSKTVNFPSRDAFLQTPGVWNAHCTSAHSMEWVKEGTSE